MPSESDSSTQNAEDSSIGHPDGDVPNAQVKVNKKSSMPVSSSLPQTFLVYTAAVSHTSLQETLSTSQKSSQETEAVTDHRDPIIIKGRAFSTVFKTVYPERWKKEESIGVNPVQDLSDYHKKRLGLEPPEDEDYDEEVKYETDTQCLFRFFSELCNSFVIWPIRSISLCCRSIWMPRQEQEELEMMFQPRTQNALEYIEEFQEYVNDMPESIWRRTIHDVLIGTVDCSARSTRHFISLIHIMDQFRSLLAFSYLYVSDPVSPAEMERAKGRSVLGGYVYFLTFIVTQLKHTHHRMHQETQAMAYVRKEFEELIKDVVILWTSTNHAVSTTEIILQDMDEVVGDLLFHVKPGDARDVDLSARHAYREQARVRQMLRKSKIKSDEELMYHKTNWPFRLKQPPLPNFRVVSRNEESNVHWHPLSLFTFQEQIRIIIYIIKRAKEMISDSFQFLTDYDRILHTHRPSRKSSEIGTLFEGVIYLKDRFLELNHFPTNMLKEEEVEHLYEVGRVLADKVDELYICLFASRDVVREGIHVVQLCHEYLRAHEQWPMDPFHVISRDIIKEYKLDFEHFIGFDTNTKIHIVEDPIPLFNASIYPSIIRQFPVKVAKLYLSFQTPEEVEKRQNVSSISLWDAFDTIRDSRYEKKEPETTLEQENNKEVDQ